MKLLSTIGAHQRTGVDMIRAFKGRALLADEMGLGKTFQLLLYMYEQEFQTVVVVCPANVKHVWETEARTHFGIRSEVLDGRKPPTRHRRTPGVRLFVINYEILDGWAEWLKALGPDALYIDESHYMKSRTSQRFKNIKKLASGIKHVCATSGTPLTNRPAELWTALHLVVPSLFPSFYAYGAEYCNPKRTPWGWQFNGARNLDVLHALLKKTCMIRRLKSDVLKDLPAKIRYTHAIKLKRQDEYDDAANNFIEWLSKKSLAKSKAAQKSEALVKMGYLRRYAAQLKRKQIYKWIDKFQADNPGKKLVVMAIHRRMLDKLCERYEGDCVRIDGGTKKHERRTLVHEFQNGHKRLFFGNIKAAGVALTLVAAQDLLFVELPWTPGDLAQAEDRIHRIGQKGQANIHYLVARDTIEEHLVRILVDKQQNLAAVLDGKKSGDKLDVLGELLKLISKKKKD